MFLGPIRFKCLSAAMQHIDVVEIDQRVVEACRKWMTKESSHEREGNIQMIYMDGYKWIQEQKNNYDVLLVDRSDPYGPATSLYKQRFYQYVYDSLTDDGIAVFQSGSPYYDSKILKRWDPLQADLNRLQWQGANYINPEIFHASFKLPSYVKNVVKEK
ncbi:hypothetical protein [Ferviditalea candida]|uniref:PABS domain-containing protein n=1 Tax=Ferviditalea candida TaxID=3108399 RepID=A0ABU5ZCU4_9BACL|nr:hypothetical protein [Paenibacillaceae bacterium T2]